MPPVPSQIRALGRVILLTICIVAVSFMAADDIAKQRRELRGVESGGTADQPTLQSPRLGINVDLQQYQNASDLAWALDEMHAFGYRMLRQRISWAAVEPTPGVYQWDVWDRTMPAVADRGLQLVVYVNDAPPWARRAWERDNPWAPPEDPAAYGAFMAALAGRYGDVIAAYQVWDQPNIRPHWGDGPVNPAGYVALLGEASAAVRAANPEAVIVAGGLAPNTESGGQNLNELRYLQEMHRLGAAPLYDVLGARPLGFWSGPHDRRVDADTLNFSRTVLLRRELLRRGLSDRPIWALDGGWCALPGDWTGKANPSGSDTPEVQAQRLQAGFDRLTHEWPWLTWAAFGHWQPDAAADDPVWGFALHDPDGSPTAAASVLSQALRADARSLSPGVTRSLQALQPTQNPALTDVAFWGTRLWLLPSESTFAVDLSIRVDEQHTAQDTTLPLDEAADRIVIGQRLSLREHTARISADAELSKALAGFQVAAERSVWPLARSLVLGLGTVGWLLALLWHDLGDLGWRQSWRRGQTIWHRVPVAVRGGLLLAMLAGATITTRPPIALGCLAMAALLAAFDADLATLAAVATVPLAPVMVSLGGPQFSVAEIAVLLAVAARAWQAVVDRRLPRITPPTSRWQRIVDVGVIALLLAAIASASAAEFQREAWREVRLCLVEPALLYYLLRSSSRAAVRKLVPSALLLGGMIVAAHALVRYPAATGVIEAEGVRRARGFYGSPNNLALMIERLAPLALAGALWSTTRRHRLLYGAAAALLLLTLLLTFSRGALLIGLPLSLLVLGWLRGGRWRVIAVVGAVLGVIVAVSLLGTQRLASLLDFTEGTALLRLQLWRSAAEMIADHPWLGVGPDGFLYYYGDYIQPGAEVERWLSHPHNLALAAWSRLGLPGLVAMLTLLAGGIAIALQRVEQRPAMAIGLAAALAAALGHGLVDSSFFVPELALWLMVALACLGAYAEPDAPR